jgi:UDP-glucose 4-epimerase
MLASSTNQYFNVGTGIKTSIADLAARLSVMHPKKMNARFEFGKRPFVQNRVGATEKANREINFNAEIDLDRGLRNFIEWRQKNKLGTHS